MRKGEGGSEGSGKECGRSDWDLGKEKRGGWGMRGKGGWEC